jgi:hypothetical protein
MQRRLKNNSPSMESITPNIENNVINITSSNTTTTTGMSQMPTVVTIENNNISNISPEALDNYYNLDDENKLIILAKWLRDGKEEYEYKNFAIDQIFILHNHRKNKKVREMLYDEQLINLLLMELINSNNFSSKVRVEYLILFIFRINFHKYSLH